MTVHIAASALSPHRRHSRTLALSASVLVLSLVMGISTTRAADVTWSGAGGDSSFNTGTNWAGNTVPGASDRAIMDNGGWTVLNTGAPQVVNGVVVGAVATANDLSIWNGSTLNVTTAVVIGRDAGSAGGIEVATGSQLNANLITIGQAGMGVLEVKDGSVVTSASGIIAGSAAGSDGRIEVSGSGSTLTGGILSIGISGSGRMSVSDGGIVNSTGVNLAGTIGATAIVDISGAGTVWNQTGLFRLGMGGEAELTISGGGVVNSADVIIAAYAFGIGRATITGLNSAWVSTGEVTIAADNGGATGSGTLTIADGAIVSDLRAFVATAAGSTGVVEVTGSGSRWLHDDTLSVGVLGNGSLTVGGGGDTSVSSDMFIGAGTTGVGSVTVRDATSTLQVGATLHVGEQGAGSLLVENGGAVTADRARVANLAGSSGTVTVRGTGSSLTLTNGMSIGREGTGTMLVENGATARMQTSGINIGGLATGNGTLTISGTNSLVETADRVVVGDLGTGVLTIANGGKLSVNGGANALTLASNGSSDGVLNIGGAAGAPAGGAGTLEAARIEFGSGTGSLNFNHTDTNYVFSTDITGAGAINQRAGTTRLTGDASGFTGITGVSGGTLRVDGSLGGNIIVLSGGSLGGSGTVGSVVVNNGGILLGQSGQTLGMGSLVLGAGSTVNASLGAPGGSGLFNVAGNLTLAGTLNVTNAGGFGAGVYRIFDYGGTLTDNGMTVGTLPNSLDGALQTSVAQQVNLLVQNTPADALFWNGATTTADGAIHGGSGTWEAGPTNWTDVTGATASAWNNKFAIFQNNPGAVTVNNGVTVTGMQFVDNGWVVGGDAITLNGASGSTTIRVGDGSAAGASAIATINAQLSGNSRLVKDDLGTLVLTENNSYTGGTTVNAGTLRVDGRIQGATAVQSGATLGGSGEVLGAVTVASGGTLSGVQGQTLTLGSLALSSSSNVNVTLGAPASTALFNVQNNLTLDGTLNVTDAGGFGMGVYRIFDYGGTLTDNGMSVGTIPAGWSGTVQNNAGFGQVNLVVSNAGPVPTIQFWNGTTTVADGTVHGGAGTWTAGSATNWTDSSGATASAWGSNFAVFQNNPDAVTVDGSAGAVSVTGMQFIGTGWNVSGDAITLNGAGGSTTVRVGDGTAAGASHLATIASALTGASRLVKDDLGTLVLTGANSYTGGTAINAGTLQIGNGGTSGSITGDVLNNGTLAFNRSDATSFGGLISGTGAVQLLNGTVTLTADNSYTGGTGIGAGSTLRLGNGGTTGSVTGNIANNGTLIFDRSNALSYGGAISGSGLIRQAGSGVTTLTGDSSGFSGLTRVENGILAVNGALGGALEIQTGGRLQGSGTVGTLAVNGVIAPGNSIGTLNVGSIAFAAGSVYEVEVNAAGQSDRINASGTATINGGSVQVLAGAGNYAPATTYTILSANGGRTGTFTGGVTSNLAFLDPSLSYDANNVYLTMTRNNISFQNVGITPNQIATGGGVESLGLGNAVYDAVLNLSAPQAQYAFDQLSGEVHASARTALIEDSRFVRNAVNDRIRAAFDGVGSSATVTTYVDGKPVLAPANTDRFAIWGQGFGSWGHTNGDGNAARLNRSTGGFFVGADAPVFDNWRFGAVAGYSSTSFDVKDRHSSGSSDNYHVGLYGGTAWGDLAFRTGAAYTWHDISTSRGVNFPGFGNSLKGDYNAATAQVFGELAYGFTAGGARFEPFANLAYVNLHSDGFSERGGAAALTSASADTDATFTTLGLRASTTFAVGGSTLTAKGMLGWRHAFGDVTPLSTMRFAGGGNAFSIGGVPITRDAAVVEAGLDYAISPNATLGVTYGGQFGSGLTDQSLKANLNVKF